MGEYQVPINLFSAGTALGFISSAPPGPINLTVMTLALRMETPQSVATAAAVALVDGVYAFAAVSTLSLFSLSLPLRTLIELVGALIVVAYGVYLAIFSPKSIAAIGQPIPPSCGRLGIGFLTGAALYISNPSFVLFWISAAGALQSWFTSKAPPMHRLIFGIGVTVGTALWFSGLLYVVRTAAGKISPLMLRKFSLVTSGLLIGLGSYVLIRRVNGVL